MSSIYNIFSADTRQLFFFFAVAMDVVMSFWYLQASAWTMNQHHLTDLDLPTEGQQHKHDDVKQTVFHPTAVSEQVSVLQQWRRMVTTQK